MTAGQRWRKDKPTAPGWYWFRWDPSKSVTIVKIFKEDCDWRVLEMGHTYDGALAGYSTGEFQGPITPHDQEAG